MNNTYIGTRAQGLNIYICTGQGKYTKNLIEKYINAKGYYTSNKLVAKNCPKK
jgi:hypothetical protein